MNKFAIIVAGGEGTRIGGVLPKQFLEVAGRPLLWWSMKAFHDEDPDTRIILVLHSGFADLWDGICRNLPEADRFSHVLVFGGKTRTESVKNGLRLVDGCDGNLVAVHDAARPLVTTRLIADGWEAAKRCGGAVPVVAVTDSLRRVTADGSEAVDRRDFVAVQTPQIFDAALLKEAYEKNPEEVYSDDATAYEAAGFKPALFKGIPQNMKVTNPGDIEIAAMLLDRMQSSLAI